MHITMVNYTRTFNLGNYSSEKIGVEISINEGEDAKEALNTAKALVEEYHQSAEYPTPHIEERIIPEHLLPEIQIKDNYGDLTLEQQIRSANDVKVLKAYQLLVKKDPILQKAYNERMDFLKNFPL